MDVVATVITVVTVVTVVVNCHCFTIVVTALLLLLLLLLLLPKLLRMKVDSCSTYVCVLGSHCFSHVLVFFYLFTCYMFPNLQQQQLQISKQANRQAGKQGGTQSGTHGQEFGICQGWPLSSFEFTIVMSVLMHTVKRKLRQHPSYSAGHDSAVEELLYAADTILVHSSSELLNHYMTCVKEAGANYGLSLKWRMWSFFCKVSSTNSVP